MLRVLSPMPAAVRAMSSTISANFAVIELTQPARSRKAPSQFSSIRSVRRPAALARSTRSRSPKKVCVVSQIRLMPFAVSCTNSFSAET